MKPATLMQEDTFFRVSAAPLNSPGAPFLDTGLHTRSYRAA
jgi:hypothetical protein